VLTDSSHPEEWADAKTPALLLSFERETFKRALVEQIE
jgi:hypothetical protein